MLSIDKYLQSSMSTASGKACAVARLIAFASLATTIDIEASQAGSLGGDSSGRAVSESLVIEDEDLAKQIEFWHRHDA